MFKYLLNSNISLRVAINPFQWNWKPFVSYDGPTPIFPKRWTYAVGWLFIQLFLDVSNGEMDVSKVAFGFDSLDEVVDVDIQDERQVALGRLP